ncbi:MAG: sirohydrochlorin cobaltochelatase [Candidatus Methanoplasma sp.]|jgi:sirohydrochlorin cobaltochelatase|nr:sirohydrochlorin cobaltochelatase [Candidatus Methanoplasma sp.]
MTKKGIMIIGHGSRYEYNKNTLELQADRLTAAGFENVYIGFNETSHPFIEETLTKMVDDGIEEITAIPFFIASGLHITRDIPPKLRLKADEKDATVDVDGKKIIMHFGTPFGEDPLLAELLHENIQGLDSKKGKTGIMVIGHGSRLPYNKDIIILNSERLSKMGHNDVYYAFNEFNEPKIETVLDEMVGKGLDEIIVLPLFISLGDHLKNDVPEKINLRDGVFDGEFDHDGRKITVKYSLPIGRDPRLTDLLAKKIRAYEG